MIDSKQNIGITILLNLKTAKVNITNTIWPSASKVVFHLHKIL